MIPDIQMTQLKQHMEHVALKVLPEKLAPMVAQVHATFLAVFPSGSVNEPNRFQQIEERLDRVEKKLG